MTKKERRDIQQAHAPKCSYCGRFARWGDTVNLPGVPSMTSLDPPEDEIAHKSCHEAYEARIRDSRIANA